jgi:hypothetical protein
MNIYFSYSTKVFSKNENLNLTKKFAQISVAMFKKFYKNVYLITDTKGLDIFKDISFTETYSVLDIVPQEYKDVWSIGKLYAIKYIAEKNEQFCHVDFDFIITKELPNQIIDAEAFVQSVEYNIEHLCYNIPAYYKFCKNKYLAKNVFLNSAFNCGIVGGKNCSFFYEYADTAIKMIEDPENKELWLKNYIEFQPWTKAVIAEQYYLACAMKKFNIRPKLIFDNYTNNYQPNSIIAKKFYEETGAIHFLGESKRKSESMLDEILNSNLDFDDKKLINHII